MNTCRAFLFACCVGFASSALAAQPAAVPVNGHTNSNADVEAFLNQFIPRPSPSASQQQEFPPLPPPLDGSDYYAESALLDLDPIVRSNLKIRDMLERVNAANRIASLGVRDVYWSSMELNELLMIEAQITKTEQEKRQPVFISLRDIVYAKMLRH